MRREQFLSRVRSATRAAAHPYTRPIAGIERVPDVTYVGSPALRDLFVERARRSGWVVHEGASVGSVVDGLGSVVVTTESRLAIEGALVWPACGVGAMRDADVCVSGCVAAVAATGSVVLSSTVMAGRSVGLATPVHVVVVRPSQIVRGPGDVLRALSRAEPPGALIFVTGPSRSADIEHKLTIGVHGPREVHIVLAVEGAEV